ncbi:MAG TPA: hypothetical protein VF746_10495 [Longimicrobium sp.]|jgi:hypothetical protein
MRPLSRAILVLLLATAGCQRKAACDAELQALAIDAALGDRQARYNLAVQFYRGEKVPRDYAKAGALWRQAAAQGDLSAKNNLGFLLYHGYGMPAAPAEAVALWREAATGGQSEAHWHLGQVARDGKLRAPDPVEAYARFRAAILIAGRSSDATEGEIAKDARADLWKLRPRLSPEQVRVGEARAAAYAGGE